MIQQFSICMIYSSYVIFVPRNLFFKMSLSNEVISFKPPTKQSMRSTNFSLCLKCQKPDNLLKGQLEHINIFCDAAEVHKYGVLTALDLTWSQEKLVTDM